ncbi:hypothetical protein ACI2K4_16885 [Micromonospora sp. NPDC050397]|uniref:hypothetical protein n=1 Tax=Micromonospora sp. NPDC050397 TaxID=3364279 RepID=UPI00384C291C
MLIDCDSCAVRGPACDGCLVSALIDRPPAEAGLTSDEHRAIEVLTRAGFEVTVLSGPSSAAVPLPGPSSAALPLSGPSSAAVPLPGLSSAAVPLGSARGSRRRRVA